MKQEIDVEEGDVVQVIVLKKSEMEEAKNYLSARTLINHKLMIAKCNIVDHFMKKYGFLFGLLTDD